MAKRLEQKIGSSNGNGKEVAHIHAWTDTEVIRPVEKPLNWFARKYGLANKTTVLYSGNMGHTHDIEAILEVAKRLNREPGVQFLFIGEGAKWDSVEKSIKESQLRNTVLLPFQDEEVLPYSLSSGDIGVVPYQKGTEGSMIPSKTYYYMAAGLVPFVLCDEETDLTRMLAERGCGFWVKNGDLEAMVQAIMELHNNPKVLKRYKFEARKAVEQVYSRKNTSLFAEILKTHVF